MTRRVKYLIAVTAVSTALLSSTNADAQSLYGPWLPPFTPYNDVCYYRETTQNFSQCIWNRDIEFRQSLHEITANSSESLPVLDQPLARTAHSPRNWYLATPRARYNPNGPVTIFSHRGLVNLFYGIAENTAASVLNATNSGIYMVEIDVQSTKDGIAVALHDDKLTRPLAGTPLENFRVDEISYSDLEIWETRIKNPVNVSSNNPEDYDPYYISSSMFGYKTNFVISAEALFDKIIEDMGQIGITYVWDPKNLNAAQALGRLMMTRPDIARQSMMKTYSPYWQTPGHGVASAAENFWTITADRSPKEIQNLRQLKILPVVNVVTHLQNVLMDRGRRVDEFASARTEAKADVDAWASHFEIAAVEYPGAYHELWQDFITTDAGIGRMLSWEFPNNPRIGGGGTTRPAMIAAGYRFEDFAVNGQAYDWDMNGMAKVDNVDVKRRAICGQISNYRNIHEVTQIRGLGNSSEAKRIGTRLKNGVSSKSQVARYLTIDYPLQEAYCLDHGLVNPDPAYIWGNPSDTFNNSSDVHYSVRDPDPNPSVPFGDQGGP